MTDQLSSDIACRTCQIGGGAIDFTCVQCCVRFLGRLQNRQMVGAHLRSMRRFNEQRAGFAERLDQAWEKFVEERRKGKEQ